MKTYKKPIILISILLLNICCNKIDLPKDTPHCIKQKIKEEKNDECLKKVILYTYNNNNIYLFQYQCIEKYPTFFDSDCNLICGGYYNGGSTCTVVNELIKNEQIIWTNE